MEQTICIFGNSTTWGAWDREKGGWANRLRLFFDAGTDDVSVYNLGISGDNSRGLLKRFEVECEARSPAIIIVAIGENDSAKNSYVYVPIAEFKDNLAKIIKIARKFTDKIIFLGATRVDETKTRPVPWDKTVNYTNKDYAEYDKAIKEVAEKEKVNYLKMSDLLDNRDLEDGVHFTPKGHQKIFLRVRDFLVGKKLLA